MLIDIKKTRDLVIHYLEEHEHLRDNDEKLIATIWKLELYRNNINPKSITAFDFLQLFANGKLTNPESIRRSRAKIQETFPLLRGDKYNHRQAKSNDIKDDLRGFNDDTPKDEE